MKILAISDTHGLHRQLENLPQADVLIHAGDMSMMGDFRQTQDFLNWMREQPFQHKILVAGNHDRGFEDDYHEGYPSYDLSGIHYLMDSGIELDGIYFYGSPWQPEFMNMAFNLPRKGEELHQAWLKIPAQTQVLVTHTPPYKILDITHRGFHAGCERLAERISQLPQLKAHIFGHIHESAGIMDDASPIFVNASFELKGQIYSFEI